MQTYPKMNKHLRSAIADGDPAALYAAARIEELEQQLREAQEAAQAQSKTVQHDWLSPAEAEGLRRELRETKADLATMDADRQDDRLSNPHFGTSPRYVVEVQRDRLKDECGQLRQELQAAEKALSLAMDALAHCETAAPDLTGDVLDVIEAWLTPEALARICEYEQQGEEERCRL